MKQHILCFFLLITPILECMQKICPHQTLYATVGLQNTQAVNTHPFTRALDRNAQHQDNETQKFYTFIQDVFPDLQPSDIKIGFCSDCNKIDTHFDANKIVELIHNQLHEAQLDKNFKFDTLAFQISGLLESVTLQQQLAILYVFQKDLHTPSLGSILENACAMYVIASLGTLALITILNNHSNLKISFEHSMIPIAIPTLICVFLRDAILAPYNRHRSNEKFVIDPKKRWNCFNNQKLSLKLNLIDHLISELQFSIKPYIYDDEFKKIARKSHHDIYFSFK
jgi:hypothetical protein